MINSTHRTERDTTVCLRRHLSVNTAAVRGGYVKTWNESQQTVIETERNSTVTKLNISWLWFNSHKHLHHIVGFTFNFYSTTWKNVPKTSKISNVICQNATSCFHLLMLRQFFIFFRLLNITDKYSITIVISIAILNIVLHNNISF